MRVIHIETGITAIASDERSQYQNKKLAMERLKVLLEKNNNEAQIKSNRELFMNHNTLERGNPIWIYEGISFQRVDKG